MKAPERPTYRISLPDVTGLDPSEAPVAYAKAGFKVFPVEATGWDSQQRKWSKRPHRRWVTDFFPNMPKGQGGFKLANDDPETVNEWFTRYPDALIGLWPGTSGVCVADLDGSDGIKQFFDLAPAEFDQYTTASVLTPGGGGGRHFYFDIADIDGFTGNGLLVGVRGETRGHSGYVCVPGRAFPPSPDGEVFEYRSFTDPDGELVLSVIPMPSWVANIVHWRGTSDETPLADLSEKQAADWINRHEVADENPRAVREREDALDALRNAIAGDDNKGRHPTLWSHAPGLYNYVGMGWLDGPITTRLLEAAFLEVKPEGKSEFDDSIADIVRRRVGESQAMGFDLPFGNGNGAQNRESDTVSNGKDARSLRTDPNKYIDKRQGIKVETLERAILKTLDVALAPGRVLYVYDSGVWRPGGDDAVAAQVRRALGERFRTTHANTMVEAIKVLPPKRIDPNEAVTRFINCKNGLLDWRTGELHLHDPSIPTINQVPHDWNPDAMCPRFDLFLTEVLVPSEAGDPDEHRETIRAVWQLLGAILYDGNPWQKAALLRGDGENGKGELIGVAKGLVGSENVAAIDLHAVAENRFSTAELYGMMANLAGDLDPKMVKETSKFKMLTGGDSVPAERKFQQPFHFVCRAFSIFSANATLLTADTSHGYYRRWLIVPFPNSFPPDRRDKKLGQDLADEMPGILVKAVAGLRDLMTTNQFAVSSAMRDADTEERRHSNPVRAFVAEHVVLGDRGVHRLARHELYDSYRRWSEAEGLHPVAARTFHGRLRQALMDELSVGQIGEGADSGAAVAEVKVGGLRFYDGIANQGAVQ
jgi:putative DNA primase/helicase